MLQKRAEQAAAREAERIEAQNPHLTLAEKIELRDRCRHARGLPPAFYPDIEKYETFDGAPV